MTPMPPKVKVGLYDYRLVAWPPRAAIGAERYGECSHAESEIRIDLQYGHRQAAKTLLHEIMHAVFVVWAIPSRGVDEEQAVSALSLGLATVWRDNPDVLAWIGEGLVSGEG